MKNNAREQLILVRDDLSPTLDAFAHANNIEPDDAMTTLIEDGLEMARTDPAYLLELFEDCQALMKEEKEKVVCH